MPTKGGNKMSKIMGGELSSISPSSVEPNMNNIGASGYGVSAIGTNQTVSSSGGINVNPGAYSGGKKSYKKKLIRKTNKTNKRINTYKKRKVSTAKKSLFSRLFKM